MDFVLRLTCQHGSLKSNLQILNRFEGTIHETDNPCLYIIDTKVKEYQKE